MELRRGVILVLVFAGGLCVEFGTPAPYRALVLGGLAFLLAYVYAQLTRPKDRL